MSTRTRGIGAGLLAAFCLLVGAHALAQAFPPGATSVINEDRFGGQVAMCVDTGEPAVLVGPRKIMSTAVWAGGTANLHRVNAGLGACDPAWSPDGRRLAVVAAEGLWIFPSNSAEGSLRVEAKPPLGELMEFTYRAFSHPVWSPDGALVALLVTNGGTSWVEVFEPSSGRLFYTSPPEIHSVSWGASARELKVGQLEVHLPAYR